MYTSWPGDAYTLLLGAGLFIALMVAGLVTSARGSTGVVWTMCIETSLTGHTNNCKIDEP